MHAPPTCLSCLDADFSASDFGPSFLGTTTFIVVKSKTSGLGDVGACGSASAVISLVAVTEPLLVR